MFRPPSILRPLEAVIQDRVLRTSPSADFLTLPPPGTWRSFAEGELGPSQIAAIALRFAGLTINAETVGEPLVLWERLYRDLNQLAPAWGDDGALADPRLVARARIAAHQIRENVVAEHLRASGQFVAGSGNEWDLVTTCMAHWWRLSAVNDLYHGAPMTRCRHCFVWFSLAGHRSDASFCCGAHRSAFHQKRKPASFWAEAL